ncbi:40S ribosomal protein S7 [Sarcoptes scabiei]|uniref:40S ribosomal protein S7 n=1 Tax=Sarcoptes scabiei TaxID=52283 RepID=A0A834VAP3_SARSC|nr:40S ribosomal protein S7 [Sarcoptes scabiei]
MANVLRKKIMKAANEEIDSFEASIAQALLDLEMNTDLKPYLRELHITGAKEVDVAGKKAIIISVPVPQLKAFQKIQNSVVRELEKKFSGKHVVIVAKRTILPKPTRKLHLVYPAEIVGKRTRIRLGGSRLFKIHLDKSSQTQIEHKLDTFAAVYKKLTGREVIFEFPEPLFK